MPWWRLALCLLCGLAALLIGSELPGWWRVRSRSLVAPRCRLYSRSELGLYGGQPGSAGLYLALLGQVFDVSKGSKHYGPGGSYSGFAGTDASRAFVSGDFSEAGLVEDVDGLSPAEILALQQWLVFYQREYVFKGTVVGSYYDQDGEPTPALRAVELAVAQGLKDKVKAEREARRFPPCNSEWSAATGGRVWCSTHSGGVERSWVGVPRQLYQPGSTTPRCVCTRTTGLASEHPGGGAATSNRGDLENPTLREYEGCDSQSPVCAIPER
uniref:Neuferricin n=1 Tax=Callorhinchus milii TaxID=7868 RepID=A0A4W3I9L0_CALMI|eukprot:gi/632984759/ref/XP_007909304.1/ PREDICTED: neuferricin [Callorhinchus milii]